MENPDKPHILHARNFGISALIATIILLAGAIAGAHFIFGFGVFMLIIIGILSMLAVIEYVLGLV